ncbi:MAG: 5'-3' exonuclease [Patescibacteria group bacterium]
MVSSTTNNKLILVDGHSVLHRAYHAFPKSLSTSEGELTNAVYGFTRGLLSVLGKFGPQWIAVCFDTAGPTFRHEEYKPYKEHRPEMEEELKVQLDRVHQVVETFDFPTFEMEGYEADDLIGTLCLQAEKKDQISEIVVVTDDRDLLQLVNEKIKVYLARRDEVWDKDKVRKEYGFEPKKIVDYKALRGDPSDNIPGVRGVGPQRAKDLLANFSSLEDIYQHLEEVDPKISKLLTASEDNARVSKRLADVLRNLPIELDLEKCRTSTLDREELKSLFMELEFNSLLKKLPEKNPQMPLL